MPALKAEADCNDVGPGPRMGGQVDGLCQAKEVPTGWSGEAACMCPGINRFPRVSHRPGRSHVSQRTRNEVDLDTEPDARSRPERCPWLAVCVQDQQVFDLSGIAGMRGGGSRPASPQGAHSQCHHDSSDSSLGQSHVRSLPIASNGEYTLHHPALVLSPASYNGRIGLAVVCPITTQVKQYPFEVTLPQGLPLSGAVLCDQVKSLDWRVPESVVDETRMRLRALLD